MLHTALLKFFDDKVSLTQGEINKNSSTVNGFLKSLLPLIQQQDELFGLKKLNTGKPPFSNRVLLKSEVK